MGSGQSWLLEKIPQKKSRKGGTESSPSDNPKSKSQIFTIGCKDGRVLDCKDGFVKIRQL
jgi:hypothetical protein